MMHSRRDFGKIALAGLPLSIALAKIDSKINGVQLGVQTYSFRELPQENIIDTVIKAMTDIGLGMCELFGVQVEPGGRPMMPPGGARPPQAGAGGGAPGGRPQEDPERAAARAKAREDLRKWRLSVSMDHFKNVRKKFDAAGINIYAYNLSFNDSFTDEEIDRGFDMAKALGVKTITASTTLKVAKRVAPFADKHKMIVAMHGHSNVKDPNEFAKPESFQAARDMSKYFWVNLDIGHFFAAGYDPVAYIQEHHDRISNLHLKDRKKDQGPNTPWGQGDTPIKDVLLVLKDKKYPIPAFIEYEYRGTDGPVAEVKKCFQYSKDALA
jgi:sugar phosphate isomerase/epimerase